MKAALDTNVLVYAEGINAGSKHDAAIQLIRRLPLETTVLPVQALGEFFHILVRKGGWSREDATHRYRSGLTHFPSLKPPLLCWKTLLLSQSPINLLSGMPSYSLRRYSLAAGCSFQRTCRRASPVMG